MRIVIVGNGLAGTMTAKALRDADPSAEIALFSDEDHPYYPRPNLIEFIAGRLPYEKLFAFPRPWYDQKALNLRLAARVVRVDADRKVVETADGGTAPYDVLCLAEGASSFVPPIQGAGKKGVFTLRKLDDALAILDHIGPHPRAVVVGGGLLGLEIARALGGRGADVEVVEVFPILLPRQLDAAGAAVLRRQVEASGLRVRLGAVTEEILGRGQASGLRLKSGDTIEAETIIIAAGVRPNTAAARSAGVEIDRGVVVDDFLRTSRPGIFAAGDGVQHRGRIYGIIPASFAQARAAAANILGGRQAYEGTVPSSTLKVAGLHLTSAGLVNAEAPGQEELRRENPAAGTYKKIVVEDGRLVGAVWLGTKTGAEAVIRAVAERRDIGALKHELLAEGFDFERLK